MDASIAFIFYRTDNPAERRTIASTFLFFEIGFTLAVCGLLFTVAQPIAALAFGDASLTPYVQLGLLTVPFAIYVTMFLDIARLVRTPLRYMAISLGNLIVTATLSIVAVLVLGLGVGGILAATLVGSVLFGLVGFYATRAQYGPFFSGSALKRMILLGLPLVPAALSLWIISSSNRWFVLHITSSAEQVAILALATRLAAPVVLVVTAFQIAWVPFSLSIARQEGAERVYSRTLLYFLVITFLILLPLTLWAGPIIELFSTSAYLPAANLIALTGMISIASGAYYIVATGVNLSGKTIHIGWTTMVAAGVSIVLNLTLIPALGVLGAAFAGLVASLTPVVLLYILSQRIHPLPYDLPRVLVLSGLGSLMLLAATLLHIADPLVDFLARVAILVAFVAGLFGLGVIRPKDLREMGHMLSVRVRRGADV